MDKSFSGRAGVCHRPKYIIPRQQKHNSIDKNGKRSAGKRSRALNIRYFFLTDQQEKGNLAVEYCPTGDMVGDFMTKPLQGRDFRRFRNLIMGVG